MLMCRAALFASACLAAALRSPPPPPRRRGAGATSEAPYAGPSLQTGLQTPEGLEVEPVGRHIQYLWMNHPHGLTDRLKYYIRPLTALGQCHNATVHMLGGQHGPRLWLDGKHSADIAESWSRYFNVHANGGNPWHELVNFKGCRSVEALMISSEESWGRIFDGGVKCVNIVSELKPFSFRFLQEHPVDLPVSSWVRNDAARFLRRQGVTTPYASVHVRRCDRFLQNRLCTSPEAIYEQVKGHDAFPTWLFFMYTEEGYREELRQRLLPLGRRFLFEDEVKLSGNFQEDNYYIYILGKYLNGGAALIVESHMCHGDKALEILSGAENHGILLPRAVEDSELEEKGHAASSFEREEAYLSTEENYAAVCDDRERGAHLIRPR